MRRYTTADITLSDGIIIPKDNFTFVAANGHWDASVYKDPDSFDPYRFLGMRQQPGKSLSSIHTTALTMTQALYDRCARPEFLEPIREELVNVLREEIGWQKQSLNRFRKLESLIKESQRFNPVFLVTFNRIYHQSMTLSDGTHLPAGTRIAVPLYSMSNDAAHVPGAGEPAVFNPFCYS